MVENLENENFTKIAAPIYGRGFVKLYCEAVGIDPEPLVREFMDIYNGNRTPTIRMREKKPAPVAAPAAAPVETPSEPIPAEPPAAEEEPVKEPIPTPPPVAEVAFSLEQETIAPTRTPAEPPAPEPPAPEETEDEPEEADEPAEPRRMAFASSRYAPPLPPEDAARPRFSVPPAAWRILLLAIAAAFVLWVLLVCVKALYHATMTPPAERGEGPRVEETAAKAKTEAPAAAIPGKAAEKAPRKPMDVPPLYID
jgi:hypothetical protein